MNIFKELIINFKNSDTQEQYIYIGSALGAFFLIFGFIWYFTNTRVSKYNELLTKVQKQKSEASNLIEKRKVVLQHKEQVDSIIEKNKDFRPTQAYQNIIRKLGLEKYEGNEKTSQEQGEKIDGKVELRVVSSLFGITMKQVTDLLNEIATVNQLYPKSIIIKKNPSTQTVDIDLTIASLEQATEH